MLVLAAAVPRAQAPAGQPIPSGPNVLLGRIVEMTTGDPVPGAVVSLTGYFEATGKPSESLPQPGPSPLASAPRGAITTADGYFVFRGLTAGNYAVSAMAYGFVTANNPRTLVEVGATARPASVTLRMWQVGAIAGRVVDDRGEPVVGAPVSALRRVLRGGGVVLERTGPDVETDDRGLYRISQLQPGTYLVAVIASSFTMPMSLASSLDAARNGTGPTDIISELLGSGAPVGVLLTADGGFQSGRHLVQRRGPPPTFAPDGRLLTYATTLHPGTTDPAQALAITIASGESRTGIDVPIRFAPTVRVSGVLKGQYGVIGHTTVRLIPPNAVDTLGFDPGGVASAITDDDGTFSFVDVAPGQYVLTSMIANEADANEGTPAVAVSATQSLTVTETDVTGLTVMMQPGVRISGRVEFVGDAPPAQLQAVIGFRPAGAQSWRTLRGVVQPNGTFSALSGPPGRYVVTVLAPPGGWSLLSVSRGSRVLPDDIVELGTSEVADLVVKFSRKTTRVSGTVVSDAGAIASDADIVVFPSDSSSWRDGTATRRIRVARATTSGRFDITGLPAGDYYVAAIVNRWMVDPLDPALLARVVVGATKISLAEAEQRTIDLKPVVIKP